VIDRHGKIASQFIGFQQWDSPDMLAISIPSSDRPENENPRKI